MSKKNDSRDEFRRELRAALNTMRKEVAKVRKDISTATKTWAKTTSRIVQDVRPKVSATIDDTIDQTSAAFRKTMASVGKETKQAQIGFLRSYRTILTRQMDFIEKRLKELTE